MAASVCGKRRRVGGSTSTSAKRARCLSSFLDQLLQRFPATSSKVRENVGDQSGNDLEAAIAMLYKIGLEHGELDSAVKLNSATIRDEAIPSEDSTVHVNNAANGVELVELIVTEMKNATSIDDAKTRAARVLQNFEETIHPHTTFKTAQNLQESLLLKEKLDGALRENEILKRAVAIQLERQKGFNNKVKEVQHMKQLVTQYREQLKTLEVKNYALTMHLQQATQQGNFTHGRFPPDVY